MKEYTGTRPILRELLSRLGVSPLREIPHPTHKGWRAWIYDRSDPKTDLIICTYYTILQIEDER